MSKYLISCGGTGGHLAPGIAIGEALASKGHDVSFIISEKAIDSRLSAKYKNFKFIKTPGLPFSPSPIKFLKFLISQFRAVKCCKKIFMENNADVAIAFGGFNSMGLAIAAWLAKKPLVLHEANRKPGKAVRLFGFIATRVYLPHGVRIEQNKSGVVRQAGYPIRSEIFKKDEAKSKELFGFGKEANIVLVCGGSQGAAALNRWAKDNFEHLAHEGIDIFCIAGPSQSQIENRTCKDKNGIERHLRSIEFCDNMAEAMSAAKIVVARAGAGSIAEFARCRTIPILVPFPFAADNHQLENARYVEKNGAGICVLQENISSLSTEVLALFGNPKLCEKMRHNLEKLDELNGISKFVSDLEELALK